MNPGKLDTKITLLSPSIATANASELEVLFEGRVTNDFGEVEDSGIATALSDLGGVTNDSYGEAVVTYSTLASVWAKVDEGTGLEKEDAEKETAVGKVTFIIRYRADVHASCRITYGSDTYNIRSLAMIGRKRFLEIKADKR